MGEWWGADAVRGRALASRGRAGARVCGVGVGVRGEGEQLALAWRCGCGAEQGEVRDRDASNLDQLSCDLSRHLSDRAWTGSTPRESLNALQQQ